MIRAAAVAFWSRIENGHRRLRFSTERINLPECFDAAGDDWPPDGAKLRRRQAG
jgi:hypothetical protein